MSDVEIIRLGRNIDYRLRKSQMVRIFFPPTIEFFFYSKKKIKPFFLLFLFFLTEKKNIRIMEASASSNQVLAEPTYDASPRTVRTNWLLFAWSQISGATKVILLVSIALSLFQVK